MLIARPGELRRVRTALAQTWLSEVDDDSVWHDTVTLPELLLARMRARIMRDLPRL